MVIILKLLNLRELQSFKEMSVLTYLFDDRPHAYLVRAYHARQCGVDVAGL